MYTKTAVLKEELLEFGLDLKAREREINRLQKKNKKNLQLNEFLQTLQK